MRPSRFNPVLMIRTHLCICLLFTVNILTAQVHPDTLFDPIIENPLYPRGKGPSVYVDAAHHNYHTASDRFAPFAKVLRKDGYNVLENLRSFNEADLTSFDLLVISNALNAINIGNWTIPTPSAFTEAEIIAVKKWVEEGGRLLLIADHMPFSGAAYDMAFAFGFHMPNCFAMDNRRRSLEYFTRKDSTLYANEITDGLLSKQFTDSIITFTGSAFMIPVASIPILKLNNYTLLSPQQAWQFSNDTPYEDSGNFFQAAALNFGKGKLIVMGEAAMFTAQVAGERKIGMNTPEAKFNIQLLRNTIQWLLK